MFPYFSFFLGKQLQALGYPISRADVYGQLLQPDADVRFGSCADGSELARSHSLFDQTRRLSGVVNAKITRT
jgi:hypothetical protein